MGGSNQLVVAGQIDNIYPSKNKGVFYLGVNVTRPFGQGNTLFVFRENTEPEFKREDALFSFKAGTLEIDTDRTNRVDPGDQCGVRLITDDHNQRVEPGWFLCVSTDQAAGAKKRNKRTWSRPIKPKGGITYNEPLLD